MARAVTWETVSYGNRTGYINTSDYSTGGQWRGQSEEEGGGRGRREEEGRRAVK